jgi:hypothetical protein
MPGSLRYNDHQIGQGPAFHRVACEHRLEGIVSKRVDGRYEPDPAPLAQDEMPQPGRICRRRLERSGGQITDLRPMALGLPLATPFRP